MILLSHKIKLSVTAIAFAFLFFSSNESTFAQKKLPRFKDYQAAAIYKGKNAPPRLRLTAKEKILFGEKLQWTIENEKVDFAGHYIVADWSCGMWCNWSAVIDAKTGKVYWWNGTLSVCFPDFDNGFDCNAEFSNVEYRIDSKLIVFYGRRNNKDGDNGFHYYKFENGRFIHLKSVLGKDQRRARQVPLDEKTNKNKKP